MKQNIFMSIFALMTFVILTDANAQKKFGGDTDYTFDVDGIGGNSYGPNGANIKVRLAKPSVCSKNLSALAKKKSLSLAEYKKALYDFEACNRKCLSYKDYLFEQKCLDWSASLSSFLKGGEVVIKHPMCATPDIFQGFLDNKYDGRVKAKDGSCKKRFMIKGESKMAPVDFYIMIDNSGSMSSKIDQVMNQVLPRVTEKIRSNYGDSNITLFTQNHGSGDSSLTLYPGATDVASAVAAFKAKYSGSGDYNERPLTALKVVLEKGKMGRPNIDNVIIIISDENQGDVRDLSGGDAKNILSKQLGKKVKVLTTLPAGENPGIDSLINDYGGRNGLSVASVENEIGAVIKKTEVEYTKNSIDPNQIIFKLAPDYGKVRYVEVDGKVLSPEYYEIRGMELIIYHKVSPGKKSNIYVAYEYRPVLDDPIVQKDKIINWYVDDWISEFSEKPIEEIKVLTMSDSDDFDHLFSYIVQLKETSIVNPFFGAVKKLDSRSLSIVFTNSGSRQKLVDYLLTNMSQFKNKKEFKKVLEYLKKLIAADMKGSCKGTGGSFTADDYSKIQDADEKRMLVDMAEMIKNYEMMYIMKCATDMGGARSGPSVFDDCDDEFKE